MPPKATGTTPLPTGAVVLLHAPLLVPSDAAARGKKPRELPQAAPSATRGRPSLATPLQGRGPTCTFWSKSCLRTCHKCASAKAPRLASSVGLAWTSSWLLLDVSGVILGAAWVRKAWVRGKRTKSAERGAARQLTYLFEIKAPRARRWPVGTARGTAMAQH